MYSVLMCGIYGHIKIGGKNSLTVCLNGLKKLEYRGYDSAGIAAIIDAKVIDFKSVGKVSSLENLTKNVDLPLQIAIAHTRWATHGSPSIENAHPHFDESKSLAIVHNGIIENYSSIRKKLEQEGIAFLSETDSEVISQLISKRYRGDLLTAVKESVLSFEGSFSFAAIHKDYPKTIVCAAKGCPLIIGITEDKEIFLSSDVHAFPDIPLEILYICDGEIAEISPEKIILIDRAGKKIHRSFEKKQFLSSCSEKEGFDHYLLKEIFEQPLVISRVLTSQLDDLKISKYDQIMIVACGSSYHAGLIAKPAIESLTKIPTSVEIASEFRYGSPLITKKTLVIAISQSGETADTLAAIDLAKTKTPHIIALCNVMTSSIARRVSYTLPLKAGPEISVCSTKAFTSALSLLIVLAMKIGGVKDESFTNLPSQITEVLQKTDEIWQMAKEVARYEHVFFVGRQQMYPTCLESALKLKEISYIHALGISAGEMKHGTLALITEDMLTIALCGNESTADKLLSNLMEIKARGGPVIAFANEGMENLTNIIDHVIFLPKTSDTLSPILYSVATQLLAYYVAKERGCDIDQPRNLAKSVTVE